RLATKSYFHAWLTITSISSTLSFLSKCSTLLMSSLSLPIISWLASSSGLILSSSQSGHVSSLMSVLWPSLCQASSATCGANGWSMSSTASSDSLKSSLCMLAEQSLLYCLTVLPSSNQQCWSAVRKLVSSMASVVFLIALCSLLWNQSSIGWCSVR